MTSGEGEDRKASHGGPSGRDDDGLARRLDALGDRLDAATAKRNEAKAAEAPPSSGGNASGLGQMFKMSGEFVSGVVIGAGIGWVLDQALGTTPWGLIVFLLLGFAAGFVNLVRAAERDRVNRQSGG